MLAPIRPRPTIPIRMRALLAPRRPGDGTLHKATLSHVPERLVPGDDDAAAHWAARRIAALLSAALHDRGRASLALSGGRSPWVMMDDLFRRDLPWSRVDLLQVDERVAPDGDPQRNLTRIAALLAGSAASMATLHPMRVADGPDAAVRDYAEVLAGLGGPIDVVHLGLGADGHTAGLAPGDPVLDVRDAPVGATARPFNGTTRVTLTYPALDAARAVLWLVTGAAKREAVARLDTGDATIPAGRVRTRVQVLVLDDAAAGEGRALPRGGGEGLVRDDAAAGSGRAREGLGTGAGPRRRGGGLGPGAAPGRRPGAHGAGRHPLPRAPVARGDDRVAPVEPDEHTEPPAAPVREPHLIARHEVGMYEAHLATPRDVPVGRHLALPVRPTDR